MMNNPAPWTLHGNGVVMLAHFPTSFVRQHGFLADFQEDSYRGWLGTVMLVDYQTSNVGPYCELLFIPGLFRLGGKTTFSISKIYVSTTESVENGIENWGIPKELADFEIVTAADGAKTYTVSQQGIPFFSVTVRSSGPRLPITTKLLPGFRVMQQRRKQLLLTAPVANGTGRLARLSNLSVKSALFPDVSRAWPLVALTVDDFTMTFPVPTLV
jgi:Acetoacetate decarboxylase (ADC)